MSQDAIAPSASRLGGPLVEATQRLEQSISANANVFADKWGWLPMQTWLEQFGDLGLARPGMDGRWETVGPGVHARCGDRDG